MAEALHELFGGAGGDESSGAGGAEEAVGGEIVGVGVSGSLAGEDTDAAAEADALGGGFDEGLVDAEGGGGDGLEVEVGVVATGGESFAEAALHKAFGDSQLVDEVALVVWEWEGHLLLMIGVRGGCGNGVVIGLTVEAEKRVPPLRFAAVGMTGFRDGKLKRRRCVSVD